MMLDDTRCGLDTSSLHRATSMDISFIQRKRLLSCHLYTPDIYFYKIIILFEMRHLLDYILESNEYREFEHEMLLERNERIFPSQQGKHEKLEIWAGEHCKQRQKERNVSDKEITNAIFGAFTDIRSAYREGKIKLSYNGEDSQFVITDARRDKHNPVVVVAFIYKMLGAKNKKDMNPKFDRPSITVKTVFKGDDFSGSKASRDNAHKIFLYN